MYLSFIAVAQLVEALRYKSEGRGFDPLEFFIYIILPASPWYWG
jgi:hypothetical protein